MRASQSLAKPWLTCTDAGPIPVEVIVAQEGSARAATYIQVSFLVAIPERGDLPHRYQEYGRAKSYLVRQAYSFA